MKIHSTFPENKIDSRESRLIFVDANSGGETSQATENSSSRLDVEDWKNDSLEAYLAYLKEEKDANRITQEVFDAKNREAKRLFQKWDAEKQAAAAVSPETIKKKIERARRNRDDKKLVDKTVDAVRARYLSGVNEIRNFVRDEISDFLKIEIPSGKDIDHILKDAALEEFLSFENEILDSIAGLLKEPDFAAINESIERDKKRAKECYRKLRAIFQDDKKKKFLQLLLKNKSIPSGEQMDIETLLGFETKMANRWDKSDSLIGIVDGKKLRKLEQALDAVEMIYVKWNSVKKLKNQSELMGEFFKYEKQISDFDADMRENPPTSVELIWLAETWPDLRDRRRSDAKALKKILTENKSPSDLKLVQAFLDGSKAEIDKLEKERARIGAKEKVAELPKTDEKDPNDESWKQNIPRSTSVPEVGLSKHDQKDVHKTNAIQRANKAAMNFLTAHGRITWHSFHDIAQAFHLIKESWKKHTESYTEDKSGTIAKNLMFWRQEVQRRVHETDLIAEKGRADERKKRYKNLSYEELVAEIKDIPPKDKRRAILETLAERGNLRMSDHGLIDTVTNHSVTPKEWNYADATCDYAEIIRKFKHSIDHHFIDEVGYGQQLIDMQTSGQANKESLGEKLGDHSIAGSPGAESAMVGVQIDNAGLEGDNVVTGILKKGFGRGNKFADNLQFCTMKIRTDAGDKEIRDNASAGLDALKIVDGYLKGLLSSQTVNGISKKNEAGYTPYAAFQDVLIPKKNETPPGSGHFISDFEKWGWIKNGVITQLGLRQIINFFDSRVAFDNKGNIIHIANDSGTYGRHSTKYTSITDMRNLGIPVGDKMRTTCIKAGGVEIYDNATQRSQHNNQLVGMQQEVTFLIKAACEEIEDGIAMINYGKDEKMESEGFDRLEKGTKALEIMFGNIVKNTEDRKIFLRGSGNPAYNIMARKKDINDLNSYGAVVGKDNINKNGLKGFLDYYLTTLTHADQKFSSHYNRVMRAYNNLADPSKILPRELRDAKNKAEQQNMQKSFRDD